MLTVYWITLRDLPHGSPFGLGLGVTARSPADALELIQGMIAGCEIEAVKPVTNMDDLDAGHVLANIGNHLVRGIWFPLGIGSGAAALKLLD